MPPPLLSAPRVLLEMPAWSIIPGGGSPHLPLSGAALTQLSAAVAFACATDTIEATPILGPSHSTPQAIGKGSCASIRGLIDDVALEDNFGNNDNNGDEHSFFGKLANPDLEDLSPRNIDGNFILLFVGQRKCQETYPKTRKVGGSVFCLCLLVASPNPNPLVSSKLTLS